MVARHNIFQVKLIEQPVLPTQNREVRLLL